VNSKKAILRNLFLGIALIFIYLLITKPDAIEGAIYSVYSPISIFIYGGLIAFILSPVLHILENNLKFSRLVSILFIYLVIFGGVISFFLVIIPEVVENISDLIKNFPSYRAEVENYISVIQAKLPSFLNLNIHEHLAKFNEKLFEFFRTDFIQWVYKIVGMTSSILNIFISIIFSIFFLSKKEYFIDLFSEVTERFCSERVNDELKYAGEKIQRLFLGYIGGKTLDCVILGTVAFIGMLFLKVPYAIFIAVVITITNFIPYVGPAIGMGLALVITAITVPGNLIYMIILCIALQQLDSWVLEPKILGDKLNLSMFWTIAAVTFGGNVAGAIGIIVCIPLFAFVKEIYKERILKEENLVYTSESDNSQ